jgi:hypothetical protein
LLEKSNGTSRVALDAGGALVRDAETGAPFADTALACLVEQHGGAWVVAQNVFALLELYGELVARGDVTTLAGAAESLGLFVTRVTRGEPEGGRYYKEATKGAPALLCGRGYRFGH